MSNGFNGSVIKNGDHKEYENDDMMMNGSGINANNYLGPDKLLVEIGEVKNFVVTCLTHIGCQAGHSESLGQLLTTADHRGHYSHGLMRLENYVEDIVSGATSKENISPSIIHEMESIAWVDGQNLLGPYTAIYCMNIAIVKAKVTGIGMVCCKNANHFGIAGYYTSMASGQNMIGMAFCNTSPCLTPYNGLEVLLGSNPIAMSAPSGFQDSFDLDMATSTVAYGKIEVCQMEGQRVPLGWGTDALGNVTQSADDILNGGSIKPLGGYKGYGLCTMVEILTGILAGSNYGPNLKSWSDKSKPANLGHCFIAINPAMFASGFADRMGDLMSTLRNSKPEKDGGKVMVAGDPERLHMQQINKLSTGYIPYHPTVIAKLDRLADRIGVRRIARKIMAKEAKQ